MSRSTTLNTSSAEIGEYTKEFLKAAKPGQTITILFENLFSNYTEKYSVRTICVTDAVGFESNMVRILTQPFIINNVTETFIDVQTSEYEKFSLSLNFVNLYILHPADSRFRSFVTQHDYLRLDLKNWKIMIQQHLESMRKKFSEKYSYGRDRSLLLTECLALSPEIVTYEQLKALFRNLTKIYMVHPLRSGRFRICFVVKFERNADNQSFDFFLRDSRSEFTVNAKLHGSTYVFYFPNYNEFDVFFGDEDMVRKYLEINRESRAYADKIQELTNLYEDKDNISIPEAFNRFFDKYKGWFYLVQGEQLFQQNQSDAHRFYMRSLQNA